MTHLFRPALVAGAILSVGLAGCQKAATGDAAKPADPAAIATALKDNETQWNADYKAKDVAKVSGHYAPDAALMAPQLPLMDKPDTIKAGLTEMIADPALDLKFEADKVGVSAGGDMAYTRGHYTMVSTDPKTKKPTTETGAYVTIYKKQADGSWKAVEDIASTGAPTPAAAPAPKS